MIRMAIPLIVFGALVLLLLAGLQTADQRQVIDSPLIGKPVPEFSLDDLHEPGMIRSNRTLAGSPYVLNVWGSWCPSCRVEHPYITQLGKDIDIPLVGLNWKDERELALSWLDQFGDAWDFHVFDPNGGFGIDLGVYGAPETFLVDSAGVIQYKHVGPVTGANYTDLLARIRALSRPNASTGP